MERMLLNRLIDTAVSGEFFHEDHYGFFPFRDCQAALGAIHDEIRGLRRKFKYVLLVAVDIHAAYDSVWTDGLIYKIVQKGICGKTALWLANFLTRRKFFVKWRKVASGIRFLFQGVPQGSVLAPFLFMLYLSDLFEAIDPAVRCVIYADDIFLYYYGNDFSTVFAKIQEVLTSLATWLQYWKLHVRPSKCTAITFTRSRWNHTVNLKLHSMAIPWEDSVKILGVYFSKNLTFKRHFAEVRRKFTKRLNVMKAISTSTRGINTRHLLRIFHTMARPLLDFACPVFAQASASDLSCLQVLYNAGVRWATGLPRWTPVQVMQLEAQCWPVVQRISFLATKAWISQISRRKFLRNGRALIEKLDTGDSSLTSSPQFQLLSDCSISPSSILPTEWPHPPPPELCVLSHLFADAKHLPPDAVNCLVMTYISESFPRHTIVATDGSKTACKTAIAAIDFSHGESVAMEIHRHNSIFSAEALAQWIAVRKFVNDSLDYLLVTDSKSVAEALQHVNRKSPSVIIQLWNSLTLACEVAKSITILWVPSHSGVVYNEKVDALVRRGPYQEYLSLIDPCDASSALQQLTHRRFHTQWEGSRYYQSLCHLSSSTHRLHHMLRDRALGTIVTRLLTLSFPTYKRLHRLGLEMSPLCPMCKDSVEDEDHLVLRCGFSANPRRELFRSLAVSPDVSFVDFCSVVLSSWRSLSCFCGFLVGLRRLAV